MAALPIVPVHHIMHGASKGRPMPTVVTLTRPDVIALVEEFAARRTGGNKTEAVALALRTALDAEARATPLFGAHPGSVRIAPGVDLTRPVSELVGAPPTDAETGAELRHLA